MKKILFLMLAFAVAQSYGGNDPMNPLPTQQKVQRTGFAKVAHFLKKIYRKAKQTKNFLENDPRGQALGNAFLGAVDQVDPDQKFRNALNQTNNVMNKVEQTVNPFVAAQNNTAGVATPRG